MKQFWTLTIILASCILPVPDKAQSSGCQEMKGAMLPPPYLSPRTREAIRSTFSNTLLRSKLAIHLTG